MMLMALCRLSSGSSPMGDDGCRDSWIALSLTGLHGEIAGWQVTVKNKEAQLFGLRFLCFITGRSR